MTLVTLTQFLRRNWLILLMLAGILGFLGVHLIWYISPSDIQSMEDLNARLTDGQPTVVEFYSNL